MVRAILNGTKTQTRRVVKPVRGFEHNNVCRPDMAADQHAVWWHGESERVGCLQECPYGQPGDRLWVRETWQYADWTDDGQPYVRYASDSQVRFCEGAGEGESLVDIWAHLSSPDNYEIDNKAADRKWRPSIFMPRWASRLTLTITDVRVERLQDCSESDAEAEGIAFIREHPDLDETLTAPQLYAAVWDSINGAGAWDANPWVWVVTFRRVDP